MKESTLKKLGLTLFVIAVTAFISLSFIVDISLRNKDISILFEENNEDLANIISSIDPAPAYRIPGDLRDAFNKYNQTIVIKYGVTESELNNFIENLGCASVEHFCFYAR